MWNFQHFGIHAKCYGAIYCIAATTTYFVRSRQSSSVAGRDASMLLLPERNAHFRRRMTKCDIIWGPEQSSQPIKNNISCWITEYEVPELWSVFRSASAIYDCLYEASNQSERCVYVLNGFQNIDSLAAIHSLRSHSNLSLSIWSMYIAVAWVDKQPACGVQPWGGADADGGFRWLWKGCLAWYMVHACVVQKYRQRYSFEWCSTQLFNVALLHWPRYIQSFMNIISGEQSILYLIL